MKIDCTRLNGEIRFLKLKWCREIKYVETVVLFKACKMQKLCSENGKCVLFFYN